MMVSWRKNSNRRGIHDLEGVPMIPYSNDLAEYWMACDFTIWMLGRTRVFPEDSNYSSHVLAKMITNLQK